MSLSGIVDICFYDPYRAFSPMTTLIPVFMSNVTNTNTVRDVLVPLSFMSRGKV